jgi:hypothetical protein
MGPAIGIPQGANVLMAHIRAPALVVPALRLR